MRCRIRTRASSPTAGAWPASPTERHIPLSTLQGACYLALARRASRPPEAPPLQPIRSLAYFLPVLEEVINEPLPPGYVRYLLDKLDLKDHFSTVLEER